MNRRAMSTLRASLLTACLTLAAFTAGCGNGTGATQPPLAGAALGGPFELVDSRGKTVRWSDFEGRYRIVYFGYAYCPDVCPYDVQRMMRGYERFKQKEPALAAQIQPIFITIDPARDTPAKVGEFARAFSPDLIGLTGTAEQIDKAAKAFAAYYAKGAPGPDGEGYLMDHTRAAYLMGRKGEPIALLPVETADQGEAVSAELGKWVS